MKSSLSARDQAVIWHPYTQHKGLAGPVAIARGKGSLLIDFDGNAFIDAISSWWVTIHGHAHPYIADKIHEQAKTLEHVIFTGFTHEPAVLLAERLLPLLPGPFEKVFYSDNGSTAVEVALKMAIQFWGNDPSPAAARRKKILAFSNAYHGDTFGAMSVSGRSVFTDAFSDFLFDVLVIDTPNVDNIRSLQHIVETSAEDIAGFIYEPLLQAAGGMLVYEPAWMNELLTTVKSCGIICIADEVLTGFGRTGPRFAGESIKTKADIICLSKGLTGGTMALGVTACAGRIFDAFLSDNRKHTLFHGHSFTANPIACAASLASLDLLEKKACTDQVQAIELANRRFIDKISSLDIFNPRMLGTITAFDLPAGKGGYLNEAGPRIQRAAMQAGIYLRPLGNTVYTMPPYCIRADELERIFSFLEDLIRKN